MEISDLTLLQQYLQLPLPEYIQKEPTRGWHDFDDKHLPNLASGHSQIWSDADFVKEVIEPYQSALKSSINSGSAQKITISTDLSNEAADEAINNTEILLERLLRVFYTSSTSNKTVVGTNERSRLPFSVYNCYPNRRDRTQFMIKEQREEGLCVGAIQYVDKRSALAELCKKDTTAEYETPTELMEVILPLISYQYVKYLFSSKCKRLVINAGSYWLFIELNSSLYTRDTLCAFLWQDWPDMAKTLSNDQISKLISSYHLRQEGLVNKNIVDTEKNSTLNIQPAGAQAVNIVETAEVDLPDVENVASDDENAASDDEDVASAASTTAVLGKATPWYGCSEAEKHNNRP